MSDSEVHAIRQDLNKLSHEVRGLKVEVSSLRNVSDEVQQWGGKIDLIHAAVLKMSRKVYVPGPPPGRSLAKKRRGSPAVRKHAR